MQEQHRKRKDQIEQDFIPKVLNKIPPRLRRVRALVAMVLREEMMNAAFVGACEARSQALDIIKQHRCPLAVTNEICEVSVKGLLGYKDKE